MSEFTRVATIDELPDPGQLLVDVEDHLVVVFRVDGQVYCLEDVCTHDGGTLGEGQLSGYEIACPRHGAKFDIRSGRALTMPATEDTKSYEAKIDGQDVLVRLALPGTKKESTAADATPGPMGEISEDRIREELKKVIDPELFVNIVDLGLIYVVDPKLREDGNYDVLIEMTMTSPACPAGPQLIANSKNVVSQMDGVESVEVRIVMDPPWTPDKMTEDARDQLGIF